MSYWTFIFAAETAAAEGGGGLFDLDATLPLMAIQFLILTAILNAVFYKPLTKALDDRDSYIRTNKSDARDRLAEAERLANQYEQELADTRRQAQAIIAQAQTDAQKIAAEKIAGAQKEAQVQREEVQKELDQERQEAFHTLEQQVDALSHQIVGKLLSSQAA